MALIGKIWTVVAAMLATAGIAVGAIITAEQSGAVRENTGEMVYYEHFATPGGLGYQEHTVCNQKSEPFAYFTAIYPPQL